MDSTQYGMKLLVRIDSNLKRDLKELARKKDLTVSQLVRAALREKLDQGAKISPAGPEQ